ncbi:MAG: tRNA uridine-5-carboxymethylaminomethyl(34) synthesis GTPase MnmE [Candidatus Fluviicola riflensis]|nr:MAG: tRNA uridine-5-carboxymethylaminomethyl(34) synthesis GTPase MnmE [Candidatus Fluviicola riflensis]OGS78005.1 MAG: tRNA uridine-5-carboxymethylaminomethyl(34) synthesis GTPase MnmE [Candidatus Fluviicola riflensis]OGS85070.1 MAG: tRNA uridine-5-carboxymethylaminomethyl(34) synthesis GTPase MnmE [Fluviicola sp. RIFCSPHIGHO2_01_FULL_43_53]OGS89342.1 MAG: tRNA uridine-5-carboxymethylaminomethyl(34) synthesis GTPase MnmE [Fluviicola sp. RIFCSPHIGHO2_12_FULL_43_24]
MNNSFSSDTICALSTAQGMGAIAVIRVSGKQALEIASSVFSKSLEEAASHTAHFGRIRTSEGEIIDEVLITVLREGHSFTGEHTVEIACHGSQFIQQQILQLLLERGCRMAEPGEFTMRAFMNGRMDLSQAEAVADLIASESKRAHEVAMKQMRGGFSNELKTLREKLIHFASLVELELDFAEEDVEFADRTQLNQLIIEVLNYVQRLIQSFALGNVLKNGVPVAIVGAPNTGKSTLLNQLLGEERAIVSNIAGTTRDVIEETLNIDGILFRLIDTAGIREDAEAIEALGIERSHEKIKQAQLVLIMSDYSLTASNQEGHQSMNETEAAEWSDHLSEQFPDKHFLVVGNKADLRATKDNTLWQHATPLLPISAKTGEGIIELKKWLVDQVMGDFNTQTDTIVTNARHLDALHKTAESLEKAKWGLDTNVTGDFVAMDIRQAMFELGTITGDISTEDLLGNIFSKFCIGK